MSTVSSISAADWNIDPSTVSKKDVKAAAIQFEGLMMGQLAAMRSSDGGWLGTGEDQTSSHLAEFGEQMMAQMLASQGGLGLARLVEQGLTQKSTAAPAPVAPVAVK